MHKAAENMPKAFPRSLSLVVMGKMQKWLRPKKANMQNSEDRDEFEANENNLRKTVQQPAKNAISYNMSPVK